MKKAKSIQYYNNKIKKLQEKLKNIKGKPTEVYTRIVGYHRNVANWNKGKKEEWQDRVEFKHKQEHLIPV